MGDRARHRKDWAAAVQAYSAHLVAHPDDFAIWVQLGHARQENGDFDGALIAYRHAEALRAEDGDLLLHLGRLLIRRRERAEAVCVLMRSAAAGAAPDAFAELKRKELAPFIARADPGLSSGVVDSERLPRAIAGQVETIEGWSARGWAVDDHSLDRPAEVVFFQDGREVGRGLADLPRVDRVTQRLSLTGFEVVLDIDFASGPVAVSARLASTGELLSGSPVRARPPRPLARWLYRKRLENDERSMERDRIAAAVQNESLSIVMPIYNPRQDWLGDAIDSVRTQSCGAWELICVDDASTDAAVRTALAEYSEIDHRIKLVLLADNGGIAAATNAGLAAATGSYVGFMDQDDALEPNAVATVLATAAQHRPDLIYTDEALTGESLHRIIQIVARPAFCYDYYLSHPYFVHFVAVRRELALQIGGLDQELDISADVDFVLRILEETRKVVHVPSVVYRWRTHPGSAGHAKQDRVTAATVAALNRHLARTCSGARAHPGLVFNCHRIDHPDSRDRTLIVIPSHNGEELLEKAVASIRATTATDEVDICIIDHQSSSAGFRRFLEQNDDLLVVPYAGSFNFSAMNNLACSKLGSDYRYLCFMNNDVEAIEGGWLAAMRRLAGRSDVGAVGATLLYADRRIQHAGVVVGLADLADHAHKFAAGFLADGRRNPGYNASLTSTRGYSAVTAACMMMRRDVFEAVAGFDEKLEIGFNDTDLCLRIRAKGYKVLTTPDALLIHHESATRRRTEAMDHPGDAAEFRRRWAQLLSRGDPFYSPLLSTDPARDHCVERLDHSSGHARSVSVSLSRPT